MDLAARVLESTAPHPRELAADLVRVHDALFEDQTRGIHGAATILLGGVGCAAAAFPVAVAPLGCAAAIGIGSVLTRAVRRYREVRRFGRDAQLVTARAVAPSWHCERCAASETGFEHDDAFGRSYLLLEIPDRERLTIARVTRSWSRSFFDSDLSRIPTLYAPSSDVVLCFDPRGEPILGQVETRPLPRATATIKWE